MTHHLPCGTVVCALVVSLAAQQPALAPEHALLQQLAGTWKVTATGPTTAAGKPGPSEQLETSDLVCAGFWLESVTRAGNSEMFWWTGFDVVGDGCWLHSTFESEFGGSRIEGRGLMGFDARQKRYVRYWIDSGTPLLAISSSALDETGRKLVGTGTTQMSGGEVTIAEQIELGSEQRHVTQRLSTSDGKDAGTFEMVLTRRPAANAK
ncbi:MAG TPA: DUF1579 family protein [Planctomycetota bacterium]|nr:DUF1579 family protein [Planctomycetota bacterium]